MSYDFKNIANIDEVRTMSGGNPDRMAKYAGLKNDLKEIQEKHFGEDFPFPRTFDESYLKDLQTFAESNPEDESAQVRYQLQKERFAIQEAGKTAHLSIRELKRDLTEKYRSGNLSPADLKQAERLARLNGSTENKMLYAGIKRMIISAE